jgi:DNA-binding transcriptional MerR regulator
VSSNPELIPIGALSGLSGVPAETIRTWERRYDLLSPQRDPSGRRVYRSDDVERLQLIAKLVDAGERVADLAALSHDALRQRQRLHGGAIEQTLPDVIRAAVVHPAAAWPLSGGIDDTGCRVEVVARSVDPRTLESTEPVDVLVLDLGALGPDPADVVSELTARLTPKITLVLYHYASRPLRRSLQRRSLRLVPAQLPVDQVRRQVLDALLAEGSRPSAPQAAGTRAARFTRVTLEQLSNRRADLQCECPNHLARLVLALREFDTYSRSCAAQSRADADLHRELANGTAAACAEMEALLARVCTYEWIES